MYFRILNENIISSTVYENIIFSSVYENIFSFTLFDNSIPFPVYFNLNVMFTSGIFLGFPTGKPEKNLFKCI